MPHSLLFLSLALVAAPAADELSLVILALEDGPPGTTLEEREEAVRNALTGIGVFRVEERDVVVKDLAAARKAGVGPCARDDLKCLTALSAQLGGRPLLVVGGSIEADELPLAVVRSRDHVVAAHSTKISWSANDSATTEALESALDRLLGGRETGSLLILTDEPGATVLLDGVPRGTTPLAEPLKLVATGFHVVEVRGSGADSDSSSGRAQIEVMPDALTTARLSLRPSPSSSNKEPAANEEKGGGLSSLTVIGAGVAAAGALLGLSTGASALAIDYTLFNTDVGGTRADRSAMLLSERVLALFAVVGAVATIGGAGAGIAGLVGDLGGE